MWAKSSLGARGEFWRNSSPGPQGRHALALGQHCASPSRPRPQGWLLPPILFHRWQGTGSKRCEAGSGVRAAVPELGSGSVPLQRSGGRQPEHLGMGTWDPWLGTCAPPPGAWLGEAPSSRCLLDELNGTGAPQKKEGQARGSLGSFLGKGRWKSYGIFSPSPHSPSFPSCRPRLWFKMALAFLPGFVFGWSTPRTHGFPAGGWEHPRAGLARPPNLTGERAHTANTSQSAREPHSVVRP